jgi:prephenate dehydrogenase
LLNRIAIVGLGLIGGSLGLAFAASQNFKVAGYDIDPEVEAKALDMGCVHRIGDLPEIASDADVVFVCTPIGKFSDVLGVLAQHCPSGCIITDVGSSKQGVVELFKTLPPGLTGIAGHPMAGSEIQGITGADRYLFENAVYVLTPEENTRPEAVARLSELIKTTGAQVTIMEAGEHDSVMASVSHLPHLVACALVSMLYGDDKALTLAAGGFRDTTRIASSDPDLWTDILMSNRWLLTERVDKLISELRDLQAMLAKGESLELTRYLGVVKNTRDSLPARRRGLIPHVQEVICIVPDRPGIIGLLGTWLGEKGINIADIEIIRVREGDGGTIRLGLSSYDEGPAAVEALRVHGVKAWVR